MRRRRSPRSQSDAYPTVDPTVPNPTPIRRQSDANPTVKDTRRGATLPSDDLQNPGPTLETGIRRWKTESDAPKFFSGRAAAGRRGK